MRYIRRTRLFDDPPWIIRVTIKIMGMCIFMYIFALFCMRIYIIFNVDLNNTRRKEDGRYT